MKIIEAIASDNCSFEDKLRSKSKQAIAQASFSFFATKKERFNLIYCFFHSNLYLLRPTGWDKIHHFER